MYSDIGFFQTRYPIRSTVKLTAVATVNAVDIVKDTTLSAGTTDITAAVVKSGKHFPVEVRPVKVVFAIKSTDAVESTILPVQLWLNQ